MGDYAFFDPNNAAFPSTFFQPHPVGEDDGPAPPTFQQGGGGGTTSSSFQHDAASVSLKPQSEHSPSAASSSSSSSSSFAGGASSVARRLPPHHQAHQSSFMVPLPQQQHQQQMASSSSSSFSSLQPSTSSSVIIPHKGLRKSCQHCRKRKIRCIPSEADPATCKACTNKGQPCVFERQSTMGRPPKKKQQEQQQTSAGPASSAGDEEGEGAGAAEHAKSSSSSSSSSSNSHQSQSQMQQNINIDIEHGPSPQSTQKRGHKTPLQFSAVADDDYLHTSQMYHHGRHPRDPYYDQHTSHTSNKKARKAGSERQEDMHRLQRPTFPHDQSQINISTIQTLEPISEALHDSTGHTPQWDNTTALPQLNLASSHQPSGRYPNLPQIDPQLMALTSLADPEATISAASSSFASTSIPSAFATPSHTFIFTPQASVPPYSAHASDSEVASSIDPSSSSTGAAKPAFEYSTRMDGTLPIQTEEDPLEYFHQQPLHTVVSAFQHLFTSSGLSSTHPHHIPSLSDPRIPPIARSRILCAKAISARRPLDRADSPATPTYARSLISPLWDGLPVDLIALSTTGKPSASGPFSIVSESSKKAGRSVLPEEYLYVKLLREDESTPFQQPSVAPEVERSPSRSHLRLFAKSSPGHRYAPDKTTVGKYFTGYFNKHPLAPLIINERLFLDDLMLNKVDDVLAHVIVGSAIARAPCLGAGDTDAEDIGTEFFDYVEQHLLSSQLQESQSIQTCQALILWGTHELTHMRPRRFASLWATAELILRRRLQAFQARLDAEADLARAQSEGRLPSNAPMPAPLEWRDLVEQELTVNALWVMVTWNAWTSLSLKLPHNTMSVMAASLPLPPQSIHFSSSFAYAYTGSKCSSPSQPTVRRVIERFSEVAQLINVIVSIKSQSQARNMFAPDPPRPLAVLDDEDARIASWLVDLARFYENGETQGNALQLGMMSTNGMNGSLTISESSRAFMVVSHAILALHQVLPYAPNSGSSYGSPIPLPTVDSLRTALEALHVVSRSIQVSAPTSRTRTQAILLDAMPRVLSLFEIFTNAAISSLDHFVMMTSQRQMVHELLADLHRAISSMGSHAIHARSLDSCRGALDKASRSLRAVVDIGSQVQSQPGVQAHFAGTAMRDHALPAGPRGEVPAQGEWSLFRHGVSTTDDRNTFDEILNASFNASGRLSKAPSHAAMVSADLTMASHLTHSPLGSREENDAFVQPSSLHAYL